MPSEEEPAAMDTREAADGSPQQFCLRWNNYQTNLAVCFDQLLQSESFVDVTLACEGQSLKAHKVVLSACSPYFQTLFMDNPCRHPIIIMRDIKYCDLKAVVDFMYRGEINVSQDQISALLKVAEMLKIRGLTDVSGEHAVLRSASAGGGGPEARPAKRPTSREADSPAKVRRRSSDRSPGPSPRVSPSAQGDMLPPADTPAPPIALHADDVDIRPGIAEMIREEERVGYAIDQAKLLENSHAWLGASTSSIAAFNVLKLKSPTWTQSQLQEAIQAVVTQKMRFTQAATHYRIPKGTLYDNILGKSKRMAVLDEAGLNSNEERIVLDFCCETSVSPYNRRTKKSLAEVLSFVEKIRRGRDPSFTFVGLTGFRWWWAFCKKHSIVSLYYETPFKGKVSRVKTEHNSDDES
ncbi:protein bric-a-brac 1-like isoform X5 [Aricia agestis]|uniref:protein bric-a-brac 1-like isoform X5 n=1 Tax=Aricia agestis TaxID=91739 RepID=UPI001C2087D3|nr:protein bric-a-brac 1-like isoform X5 [Aricia agestis]